MLTPVSASCRRATATARLARTAATFCWISPPDSAAATPLAAFDLAELRPGCAAELIGHILDGAGASRRVGNLGEMQLFEQHELGIARDAPREALGQAASGGERQHRDRVGAAERCGEGCDRSAQDIHLWIALRHRAPCRFGGDKGRFRREPARRLDAGPQFSQRAEFGDGQELFGVGREPEENDAACGVEGDAAGFERAQIGECDAEHEGQFLRFRSAGIVHDAAIGSGELAEKTTVQQRARCVRQSAALPRSTVALTLR